MPAWAIIPRFAKQVEQAIKKAMSARTSATARDNAKRTVFKEHPEWFKKNTPSSKKPASASKSKPNWNLSGNPLSPKGNRSGRSAWDRLPQWTKDKLLKGKGKGMSEAQLKKYREMYRNRN